MIQRKNPALGLYEIPTLISDTTQYSEYFKVSDVPQELTSGKNCFKIFGNTDLLKQDTEILVEVTDTNNNPIYHHVNKYVDTSGRRLVSIYVYTDTPAGIGRLTILGVAKFRPNGNPVPNNWSDRYNIKWSTILTIDPTKSNNSEIIFENAPGVSIEEKVRGYLEYVYEEGDTVTSSSAGTITYSKTSNDQAFIDITGNEFTFDMFDLQFTSLNHGYTLPTGKTLAPGETLTFTPAIISVINNSRIQVSPWTLDIISEVQIQAASRGSAGAAAENAVFVSVPTTFSPPTFETSDFEMTWTQTSINVTGSSNSQSFASIVLKNLDPISGDVYSVKTYVKSQGFSSYVLASVDLIEDNDLLGTSEGQSQLLPYDSLGNFTTQSVIDANWLVNATHPSAGNFSTIPVSNGFPKAVQSNFPIMSGVTLSGSELVPEGSPGFPFFQYRSIAVHKDNEYAITMDIQAEKVFGQTEPSEISIYVSGSGTGGDPKLGHKLTTLKSELEQSTSPNSFSTTGRNVQFSRIALPRASVGRSGPSGTSTRASVSTIPASFESNTVTPIPVNNGVVERQLLDLPFIPPTDTNLHIIFVVKYGRWFLGDVSIRGSRQTGFTPNHTFLEIPIPTQQADDILDFKFEFCNPSSVTSNVIIEKTGVDFKGSNFYISGDTNQLSGSIEIGDGFIMEGFDGTLDG